VLDEHVELLERALVHEQVDALARGELAALVLRLDTRAAAALPRPGAPLFELVDDLFHRWPARMPESTTVHIMRGNRDWSGLADQHRT
jgi:hypothetical protein